MRMEWRNSDGDGSGGKRFLHVCLCVPALVLYLVSMGIWLGFAGAIVAASASVFL
jgi:hypothetical protein